MVPTNKLLLSVSLESEVEGSRTYQVTVDSAWWSLEEATPLSVFIWSPKTQQKVEVVVKCAGPRFADHEGGSWFPWLISLVASIVVIVTPLGNLLLFTFIYILKQFCYQACMTRQSVFSLLKFHFRDKLENSL